MGRCDIYHIYWGTAGNAGLYLDEIYQVLKKEGYSQKCFVNYYYPFDYGQKVFFKYTELGHCSVKRFRPYIRYLELLAALLVILFRTIVDRPRIINYSLLGSFAVVRCYLWIAQKIVGSKIVLTCHDIIGSETSLQGARSEMGNRKKIFRMADYYLVHNDYSIRQLIEDFSIDVNKIVRHLFPIMDMNRLDFSSNNSLRTCDFLFIGHLRKEKGIDVLLAAWEDFHREYPNATLRIAGNLPKQEKFVVDEYKSRNDLEFMLGFLSDEDYYKLINSAKYIVLPYKRGTNSGVVSTVLSLHKDVITSDIPMFIQNMLVNRDFMFEANNNHSLFKVLERAYTKENSNSFDDNNKIRHRIEEYRKNFKKEVASVYQILLS